MEITGCGMEKASEESSVSVREQTVSLNKASWTPRYLILDYLLNVGKKVQYMELARSLRIDPGRVKKELYKLAKDPASVVMRTRSPVSKHYEYLITVSGQEVLKQYMLRNEARKNEFPEANAYDAFRWLLDACREEPRTVRELAKKRGVKESSVRVYTSYCTQFGLLEAIPIKIVREINQKTKTGRRIKRYAQVTYKKYKTTASVGEHLKQNPVDKLLVPECKWREYNWETEKYTPTQQCPNYHLVLKGTCKHCFSKCPDARK